MGTVDLTIERIRKLEEEGKQEVEKADLRAGEILKKAKEEAVVLVEEYEKTKDAELSGKLSKAEQDVKKESEKILSKAKKTAEQIRETTNSKIPSLSKKLFELFRKELL